MRRSAIRELFKTVKDSEIISFAAGLPNPDTFPMEDIELCINEVIKKYGKNVFQYETTQGLQELKELIAERSSKDGINATADDVVIMSGSQQALDTVGKIFLNPGDTVLCGLPSYLGGINAFRSYEANLLGIPLDEEGLKVDLLEEKLKELIKDDIRPKFLYTVPTFQNPAGVVMSESRRKKIIDLAEEYDFLIIEDDPYSKLAYDVQNVNPIKAFDDEGRVIYISTFSKILAPGLRLAWTIANKNIIDKIITCKQSMDICTNTFAQYIALEFIQRGLIDDHIARLCEIYRLKRDKMIKSMENYFPDCYTCYKPKGGMFAWVTLTADIDTEVMLLDAIKEKVVYVHGKAFHVDGGGKQSMRLNFSYPADWEIEEGIMRLGIVINKKIEKQEAIV